MKKMNTDKSPPRMSKHERQRGHLDDHAPTEGVGKGPTTNKKKGGKK